MTSYPWNRGMDNYDRQVVRRSAAIRLSAHERAAELEDIDLATALSMIAKLCSRLAKNIVLVEDDREEALEVAAVLEKGAQLVRDHARMAPGRVIEGDATTPPPELPFRTAGP